MSKDRIRFLALGFFLAAVILAGFQVMGIPVATERKSSEEYKIKYESISAEYEALKEAGEAVELKKKESNSNSIVNSPDSESSSESVSINQDSVVFIIREGEPSSSVLQNLLKEKLIEDYDKAQTYLIEQQRLTSIQYGSYTLSKDMGYEKILDIITVQE